MTRSTRAILTMVGALATLSLLISTAYANHLSSSTQTFRATWTSLELVEPLGGTVRCSLTLEGSLHSRTISKTPELLVGAITRASIANPCVGGGSTIPTETLPWHLRYAGFQGVLPNITSLLLRTIGLAIRFEGPFGACLFTTSASQPVTDRYSLSAGHAVNSIELSGRILSNEGCGPFGERVTSTLQGRSATNSAQTITLI